MHRSASTIRDSFTLVELLIVVAIVGILAVVVVLALNPVELLRQGRDSSRLSDLDTINKALALYQLDQASGFLGTSTVVYVSVPDTTSTCANLGLPALAAGYTYNCVASSTVRVSDGTGWLPVNFNAMSTQSPLSSLPVDPVNAVPANLYYIYTPGSGVWEVDGMMESKKYRYGGNNDVATNDGGDSYELVERGNSLSVSPISDSGLAGFWQFDEGSGSTATDRSGNGNAGTLLSGTTLGASGSNCKINGCLSFDGSGSGAVSVPDAASLNVAGGFTISVWGNPTDLATTRGIMSKSNGAFAQPIDTYFRNSGGVLNVRYFVGNGATFLQSQVGAVTPQKWDHWAFVFNGTSVWAYQNGALSLASTSVGLAVTNGTSSLRIGNRVDNATPMNGYLDDVRLYNRALSAAEIKAIYIGTR